jgi:hypothetical protein
MAKVPERQPLLAPRPDDCAGLSVTVLEYSLAHVVLVPGAIADRMGGTQAVTSIVIKESGEQAGLRSSVARLPRTISRYRLHSAAAGPSQRSTAHAPSRPAGLRGPKNSGPDHRVPVISRAMRERLRCRAPRFYEPPARAPSPDAPRPAIREGGACRLWAVVRVAWAERR